MVAFFALFFSFLLINNSVSLTRNSIFIVFFFYFCHILTSSYEVKETQLQNIRNVYLNTWSSVIKLVLFKRYNFRTPVFSFKKWLCISSLYIQINIYQIGITNQLNY